jgi:replicative DNA helicase
MATKEKVFAEIGLGELLNLETSVLRTLCLTVNTAGSELKYKILDTLSSHDFYFPVNSAIFEALEDMHRKGDYIVHNNLDEDLRQRSVDYPEGFFLEDLFAGDLPHASELGRSVARIKERSSVGLPPRPDDSEEAKKPAEASAPKKSSSAKSEPKSEPKVAKAAKDLKSDPRLTQVSAGTRTSKKHREVDERSQPSLAAGSKAVLAKSSPIVLASEGTELTNYLEELGSKQGKTLESGFACLDDATDGLGPGVMLVVDEERDRLSGFLKQLTDQIAEGARVPCLFVSFRLSKDVLRVRTLARLSGVSARDIEKGRLKKNSPEWKKVEQSGKQAAAWMKRVFVVEAGSETNITLIRKMCRQLLDSSGGATCALLVDGLENLGKNGQTVASCAAGLKELCESMDVVVIAATDGSKPLAEPSVDFTGVLRDDKNGMVALELLAVGETRPRRLIFEYLPSIHRFIDRTK